MGKKRKELRPMASPNKATEEKLINQLPTRNVLELKTSDVFLNEETEREFWSTNADRFSKKEFENYPPLVKAVYLGCEKAVSDLLEAGEDIHVQIPKDGSNLVMIAITMHCNNILKKLIDMGVDWRRNRLSDGTTPLMASVSSSNYPAFLLLREMSMHDDKGQFDSRFKRGETLLHLAVKGSGHKEEQLKITRTLLQLHHNLLHIEDDSCCTALCLSFMRHLTDVSRVFLEEMDYRELDIYIKRRMDLLHNPDLGTPFLERTLLPLFSCIIQDLQVDRLLRQHMLPVLVHNAEELAKRGPELSENALQPSTEEAGARNVYEAMLKATLLLDQDKRQEGDGMHRKKSPKKLKNLTFHSRFESKVDDSKTDCNANQDPVERNPHTGYADALKRNLGSESELIERQPDRIVTEEATLPNSSSKDSKQNEPQAKNSSSTSPNSPTKKTSMTNKFLSIFSNWNPSVVFNRIKRLSPSRSSTEPQTPDSSFSTATSEADSSAIMASNEESLDSSSGPWFSTPKKEITKQPATNKAGHTGTNRRTIVSKILRQDKSEVDVSHVPEASKRMEGRTYSDVARTNIEHTSDESSSNPINLENTIDDDNQDRLNIESFPELPYRQSEKIETNLKKWDSFPELPKAGPRKSQANSKKIESADPRHVQSESEESFLRAPDDSKSVLDSSFNSSDYLDEQKPGLEGSKSSEKNHSNSTGAPGLCATPQFPAFEKAQQHLNGTSSLYRKSVKKQRYSKFYRRLTTRKLCHRKLFSTPKAHSSAKDSINPVVKISNGSSKTPKIPKSIDTSKLNFHKLNSKLESKVFPIIQTPKRTTESNRSWIFKRVSTSHRRPTVREVVMQRKCHSAPPQPSAAAPQTAACDSRSRWLDLLRSLSYCMPLAQQQLEQHHVETSGARLRAAICEMAGKVLFGPRLFNAASNQVEGGNFVGLLERGMTPVVVRETDVLNFPIEDISRWRSVSHKNLAKFMDISINGSRVLLVRELCEFSLPEFIKCDRFKGSRSMPFVKRILVQEMVNALLYLHDRRIVHGFIKPNNILVSIDYRLKLTDFFLLGVVPPVWGIKVADTQGANPSISNLSWRSSELIAAKSESEAIKSITAATDIQMVGMVLYYIWSNGHHPFGDSSDLECQQKVAEGSPSLGLHPSDVEARDLVSQALKFSPGERPTVQAMARHPYFWDTEKRFQFLLKVSQKIEFYTSKPTKTADEFRESCIEARDWTFYIQPDLMRYISSCSSRKYTNDFPDLLHFAFILQGNFEYIPSEMRSFVIEPSCYILTTFPTLLMSIYHVIRKDIRLQRQMALQTFF